LKTPRFDNVVIDETQDFANAEHTHLLVQQDIQFLKESWANLADLEDQNAIPTSSLIPSLNLANLNLDKPPDDPSLDVIKHANNVSPSTTENDGFQLVTSRKKSDKSKSFKPSVTKSSFITRSKVGSSKPFK
jgi:heat shock protein HspQ